MVAETCGPSAGARHQAVERARSRAVHRRQRPRPARRRVREVGDDVGVAQVDADQPRRRALAAASVTAAPRPDAAPVTAIVPTGYLVAVGATRPPTAWVTGSGVAASRNS